jgi:hypothetical protein
MKAIILVSCFLSTASFAQVIPFTLNEDSNIVVKGKFNDSLQANLIFDTGGGLNVISNKFFQKLKNTAEFQHYFTGFRHDGDRIDFEIYKLPSLSIGNFKIKNVLVGVTELLDQWNMDGLVSLVNFSKQPITIDYRRLELKIESPASIKTIRKSSRQIPIKLHSFADISLDIFVTVCINGEQLDMEFDTGSYPADILISSNFLRKLNIDTTQTRNENLVTPFSRKQIRRYVATIDSLGYCGLPYLLSRSVRADFKQGLIYDGIIGAGYFINKVITIDIASQKIWVSEF